MYHYQPDFATLWFEVIDPRDCYWYLFTTCFIYSLSHRRIFFSFNRPAITRFAKKDKSRGETSIRSKAPTLSVARLWFSGRGCTDGCGFSHSYGISSFSQYTGYYAG